MKWFFHPSVVAFLILVAVCAIGVFIVKSGDVNRIDTFQSEKESFEATPLTQNQQQPLTNEYSKLAAVALQTTPKTEKECKEEYDNCIAKGGQVSFCFSKYKICSASASDTPITPINPMTTPTQINLENIQGKQMEQTPAAPVLTFEQLQALYKPHITKTKPHETNYTLSKSLRETLRDDVALAVQKELEMAQ